LVLWFNLTRLYKKSWQYGLLGYAIRKITNNLVIKK